MKLIINENPQQYYYGQTNPLGSDNPCPLPRERGQLGKGRGLCAWDLIKPASRFKTIKTQQEIQECHRPSFDHPKILHILIDRATGYGCKKLAAAHGASPGVISKFCQSIGFDIIKPHEVIDQQPNPKHLSLEERAIKLMEEDRTSELKSIAKYDEQRHWGAQDHPATTAWKVQKRYHSDIEYRIYQNIQGHMHSSLGAGKFVSRRLKEVLGCTVTEFKAYLERNFLDGMTWDNKGAGKDNWQIDHLKPRSWFNQTDPKQFAECWHHSNLQPAWRTHNYRKGNRFGEERTHDGFQGTLKLA